MIKNIYILCEGQTEEAFVKNILQDYFSSKEINVIPIIFRTRETPNKFYKGGLNSIDKLINEANKLCNQHPNEYVTTFVDYYGMDFNDSFIDKKYNEKYELIHSIESKITEIVNKTNFIPYLSLHEFESLLFSDVSAFSLYNDKIVVELGKIYEEFKRNPELINNSRETAPSRRITRLLPSYKKISDGIIIAKKITLAKIKASCKHFCEWINKLESIE